MNTDFSQTPPEIASVLGIVDTFLRWRETNAPDRNYKIFHPSAFGHCLRQMMYKMYEEYGYINGKEVEHDSKLLRLWEKGHNMQSRWERYFEAVGILRGIWTCSNPTCRFWNDKGEYVPTTLASLGPPRVYGDDDKIGCFKPEKCCCGGTYFHYGEVPIRAPELNIFGHSDIILDFSRFEADKLDGVFRSFNIDLLPKKPIVVDMKTINQNGFDSMTKFGKGPSWEYQIQLTIYAHILDCEYGVLIYECKNDSAIAAYKIERDDNAWNTIKRQATIMLKAADAKGADGKPLHLLPPPRPSKKTCWECKKCLFKKYCHASDIWDDEKLEEKRKKFYGVLLKDE